MKTTTSEDAEKSLPNEDLNSLPVYTRTESAVAGTVLTAVPTNSRTPLSAAETWDTES